jgi:serpin B
MGMPDAFDRARADLSGIMQPLNGDGYQVWIDRVLHKTHIEVDRKGTRAAAVTAVEACGTDCAEEYNPPVYVILDRPFIYGIIDNATGLPIFLGCMNHM